MAKVLKYFRNSTASQVVIGSVIFPSGQYVPLKSIPALTGDPSVIGLVCNNVADGTLVGAEPNKDDLTADETLALYTGVVGSVQVGAEKADTWEQVLAAESTVLIDSGVTDILSFSGSVSFGGKVYPLGVYLGDRLFSAVIVDAGALVLKVGKDLEFASIKIKVAYL